MEPQTHELKIRPVHFDDVLRGTKRAELRRDDRTPPFAPLDVLFLREWIEPQEGVTFATGYTGRSCYVRVTHVLRVADGLAPGFAMLSIRLM